MDPINLTILITITLSLLLLVLLPKDKKGFTFGQTFKKKLSKEYFLDTNLDHIHLFFEASNLEPKKQITLTINSKEDTLTEVINADSSGKIFPYYLPVTAKQFLKKGNYNLTIATDSSHEIFVEVIADKKVIRYERFAKSLLVGAIFLSILAILYNISIYPLLSS